MDVCAVSDALDALALPGALGGVVPMWQGARVVGRAVTVQLAEGSPPAGAPPVHLGARAIEAAMAGDVVVVANDGRTDMGAWGGLLSLAASLRGLAGVVVDGACRDVDEARELGFPAFARAPVCRTARGRVHEVSTGEPVSLGEVSVHAGDIVLADGSGVVVLAAATAAAVTDRAERIVERERGMQRLLHAGHSVSEVLGASYESLLLDDEGKPCRP